MKISREARRTGRKLFAICRDEGGHFSEERARAVLGALQKNKPRHYVGVLEWIRKLAKIELGKMTALVESAAPVDAADITEKICGQYGQHMKVEFKVNEELIGGLRIKIGSDVYDGSVRGRLAALERSL